MSSVHMAKGNIRKSFSKIKDAVPVPSLVEVQSSSYNDFVQLDYLPEERDFSGLEKVLGDIFPIEHDSNFSLQYVSYEIGNWACTCGKLTGIENRYKWRCGSCKKSGCSRLGADFACPDCTKKTAKYDTCSNCLSRVVLRYDLTADECRTSGQSFTLPLKIKIQLLSWHEDDKGKKVIRDIKEQNIFFADLPMMIDIYEEGGRFKVGNYGTFIINGVDRVIVSQLHRSPGVVFSQSKKVKDFRDYPYYLARIIPMRGAWIDFEFDSNDLLYVRIDKKKKFLATTFLQALGYSREEILSLFYRFDSIVIQQGSVYRIVNDSIIDQRIEKGMLPEAYGKEFVGRRITAEILKQFKEDGVKKLKLKTTALINRVVGQDIIDLDTGEILVEQGGVLNEARIEQLLTLKKISFKLVQSSGYVFQPTIGLTLAQDKAHTQEEAIKEFHSKVWPGDSASIKDISERIENLLFNSRFYDLTRVGRVRINRKLNIDVPIENVALTREDIVASLRYLVNLRERGEGELDDIDHLGNRRVRLVGELLNNQMYLGFIRIERVIRDRFRMQEPSSTLMPQDFLNVKPLSGVIREFFCLGQLSQFMDQTNPLAELAHKRRLSALGPGGVVKDRATFEIRDVHTSHYGRICPIETPEGQTVGLISSLATYAMVNDLGFIETAYRPVKDGKIEKAVVFLDAFQESGQYIAQADEVQSGGKKINDGAVIARHEGAPQLVNTDKVTYVDLSPKQLVSVSAALIPFLEHDDAVRALMGSNMQRQAVPLIKAEVPIVGTGMEQEVVKGSAAVICASRAGVIKYVSSEKIIVQVDESSCANEEEWVSHGIDTYHLNKFKRSSYRTWIHHTPTVMVGDQVQVGDILTNGQAITDGELALGSNLLVAFMPWLGYNFEDAIVLSKRLVSDDSLTSIHIEEYDVEARDTKLGPEEITRDIPNVSDVALESLDDDGIVRIGTRIKPGDILVGKVTLKGDIQYSPEEKLLRAIFGEKSREVRDTSLCVPPGVKGTVVDVKIFSRSGVRKDQRYKEEVAKQVVKLEAQHAKYIEILTNMVAEKIRTELEGKKTAAGLAKRLFNGSVFEKSVLTPLGLEDLLLLKSSEKSVMARIEVLKNAYENQLRILQGLKEEQVNKFKKGDPLPSGVIKMVKVFIAMKRTVSVGDKVAGRHGNKGVVSTIVPREDMPFLVDGTPVDVVLNPLGVPSRMNVGQVLETVLGLVGTRMGAQIQKMVEEKKTSELTKYLSSVYGKDLIDTYAKEHGQEGLLGFAKKTARNGVLFETPVFDSAQFETDIKPMMKTVDIPETGAFTLYDGRSGDAFEQPVTVGTIYMMKLNHMIDDKLHARSVGPYSLVTQQPLGGKAQQGGQRLGEMEVWALEAYGAAYTLQEMLTYKSDDVSGRHRAYGAIIRGENVPDPGVPESFNVLIKELQSLGLQIDLLKLGKENVSE